MATYQNHTEENLKGLTLAEQGQFKQINNEINGSQFTV